MTWSPLPPPFQSYKKKVFAKCSKVCDLIYSIGEYPKLRQPSKAVPIKTITSVEMQKKFTYIKRCLTLYRKRTGVGRGITGVQVGIPENFSVVYTPEKTMMIIVNPKILRTSKTFLSYPEMCMSASPVIAPVVRPSWIEFEYYDEFGKKCVWNAKDDTPAGKIMNRVFQHEIDHMKGIVNVDLVKGKDLILECDPKFYTKAKFTPVKTRK